MGRGHPLILVWINAAATALVPMYAAQLSSVAEPQPRSFSVWEPGAEGQGAKHLQLKYSSRSCCCWSGNHCSVCGGTFLRMQDTYQRTWYVFCIYQEYASEQGRGTILIKHLLSEWIHEIRSLYSCYISCVFNIILYTTQKPRWLPISFSKPHGFSSRKRLQYAHSHAHSDTPMMACYMNLNHYHCLPSIIKPVAWAG